VVEKEKKERSVLTRERRCVVVFVISRREIGVSQDEGG
jgi:hypothetical protein